MTASDESARSHSQAKPAFVTTQWTRVLAAREHSDEARAALSDLCAAYYGPVVAFLRREGRDEDTARELAHAFFEGVLLRRSLAGADPERGRFRSYLLGALKHFLSNRRAHELREKRGAGLTPEPLDLGTAAGGGLHPYGAGSAAPDASFDRDWALQVVERAMSTVAGEAGAHGAGLAFEAMKPWLAGDDPGVSQADVAAALGMTPGSFRVAIHRLRRRFREAVTAEIAQTVAGPDEVDAELRHLIASLA